MAGKNIVEQMNHELRRLKYISQVDLGKKFLEHPLMKAMFQRRNSKMQEIRDARRTTTCFGKVLKVTGTKNKTNLPSILAEQAQALEMYLLLPVLDLALTTEDFYITCWQHDGFYVNYINKSKEERWKKRIVDAVDKRARELDVSTYLETEG